MTDGSNTPSNAGIHFNGYSSRPDQNLRPNNGSTSTFPKFPPSNSIGTTSGLGEYQSGAGPRTFGNDFRGSSGSLNSNAAFSSSAHLNSGSAGSFNTNSAFSGNADSQALFGLDSGSALSGSGSPQDGPNFNGGCTTCLVPSRSFGAEAGSQGSTSFKPSNNGNIASTSIFGDIAGPQTSSSLNRGFPEGNNSGNDADANFSAIPGTPDVDYPILAQIPRTTFSCASQKYPGYYADSEARCQAFHICANGLKYDFLCPNGTIFSQMHFVCVWWNQVDCSLSETLYYLNENLYKSPTSEQAPSLSFNGASVPQVSSVDFGNNPGSQGLPATLEDASGSQNLPVSFGPSVGTQGPPFNFGPSAGSQGPSANFGHSTGPERPSVNFAPSHGSIDNVGSQGPSASGKSSTGYQGGLTSLEPSIGFQEAPGNSERPTGPQGPPIISEPSMNPQGFVVDYGLPIPSQPDTPSTNYGPQLEGTGSQMTSAHFGPFSNTQSSFNQRLPTVNGTSSDGAQEQSSNSRPKKPSSYIPPPPSAQNIEEQAGYMSNGPSQFPSTSTPFPRTASPEHSIFSQATTVSPESYQIGTNTPSYTYRNSEISVQNFSQTGSPDSLFLSNQATKPSRKYLPPLFKK